MRWPLRVTGTSRPAASTTCQCSGAWSTVHGPAMRPCSVASTSSPARHAICHGHAAACPQARHPALGPRGRESRQQVELAAIALQQHFDHRRRAAEVAVDLEDARRVQVQQRIGGEVGDQVVQVLPGIFGAAQPREQARRPRPAPAGVCAAGGQPPLQAHLGRPPQLGGLLRVQQVAPGTVRSGGTRAGGRVRPSSKSSFHSCSWPWLPICSSGRRAAKSRQRRSRSGSRSRISADRIA